MDIEEATEKSNVSLTCDKLLQGCSYSEACRETEMVPDIVGNIFIRPV
jgi:hypothetical protein